MFRVLAVITGIICSGAANASNWQDMASSGNSQYTSYIDLSTVKRISPRLMGSSSSDKFLSVFIKGEFGKATKEYKKGNTHSTYLLYINCDQNSYFTKQYTDYDKEGMPIKSYSKVPKDINDFEFAYPDSMISEALSLACNYE